MDALRRAGYPSEEHHRVLSPAGSHRSRRRGRDRSRAVWDKDNRAARVDRLVTAVDYYHCAEYLYKVAKAHFGQTVQALEWVEATLTRLYLGRSISNSL